MYSKWLIIIFLCINIVSGTLAGTNEMRKAWQNLEYLDFRNAAKAFNNILDTVQDGSDEWIEATLGLAVSLHQRQPDTKRDKIRAGKLYDKVISASDGKSIQATALLLHGKLDQYIDYFGDKENFKGAIGYYKRIITDWPDSICADQAALYMAQSYTFFMDKESAEIGIKELKSWLEEHPDNLYASTQWLFISQTYRMPLKNLDAAISSAIKAVDAGLPKYSKADNIYWQIASMAESVGNKEVAKTFYTRLIIEEQRSGYGYMAQQKLKSMGFDAPELIDPFK